MLFDVKDKVAIITGGAQGIGLAIVTALLRHKVRAVTIIDIDEKVGNEVVKALEKEYVGSKLLYAKADVRNYDQFEDAFKKTIEHFKNVDILINNAGIANDTKWVDEVNINVIGVMNGTVLAIEHYFPKYKTGSEGVVVNVASIAGVMPFPEIPLYSATKHAVIGLTRSFGSQVIYDKMKVRVVAVCPGFTDTPMVHNNIKCLNDFHQDLWLKLTTKHKYLQTPDHVANSLVKVIEKASNGSIWIAEEDDHTYEYFYPDKDSMRKTYIETMA